MAQLSDEQLKEIEEYVASLPESEREGKLKEIEKQLQETPQCPFCLMVENKIKTTRVYEDPNFIAVLEINPANPGHTLLFTKRHIKNFASMNNEETEEIAKVIKKLESAILTISGSANLLISDGVDSGNRFDHFFVNFIPRKKQDQVAITWKPNKSDEKELEKIQVKILESIPKEKPKEPEPPKEFKFTKKKYLP